MKTLPIHTLVAAVALTLAAAPALAQTAPQTVSAPARPAGPAAAVIPNTFDGPRAAATLPNTFDGPAPAAQAVGDQVRPAAPDLTAPPTAAAGQIGPDVKRAEDALRGVVAGIQGDALNYAMFSADLGAKIRAQSASIGPLLKSFGALNDVTYVGQEQGAELFALDFANARTQWIIGFNAEDEIAVLLFRPAPEVSAAPAPAPQ